MSRMNEEQWCFASETRDANSDLKFPSETSADLGQHLEDKGLFSVKG